MPHSRSLEVGISDKLSQARWDVAAPFCDRDEIWVTCCTPKSQWHFGLTLLPFMQWEHAILPKIKKFRLIISTKKTLWTMFWDRQCDLLEFMSRGVYCETFKRWGVHTEQRVWDAECQHFFFFLCFMTMIQLHSILCSKSKSNHLMQPDTNGPFHLQPWLSIKWLTPLRVLERFLAGHHVDNQDDIKGFVWEWLLWWECIINHAMIQCFSFLHSKHNLLSQHPV